ncbi:hypothetical protein [Saccharopolyspora sp. SCSIO 74807]|uniref:hypothetical protein n=1 Tax=Saccharopolyspora sp. SCSIO 74807 TaxID=3118084 RepID=UPI0030D28B29
MEEENSRRQPPRVGIAQDIWPWQVSMEWPKDVDQGGPWYLAIRPHPGASDEELAGGLSSTVLRKLDFKKAAEEWREVSKSEGSFELTQAMLDEVSSTLKDASKEGVTDEYLSFLAYLYVEFVQLGFQPVTTNLAELAGRRPETIRAHLKSARTQGLLTAVKGRAGGKLTGKAQEILASMKDES